MLETELYTDQINVHIFESLIIVNVGKDTVRVLHYFRSVNRYYFKKKLDNMYQNFEDIYMLEFIYSAYRKLSCKNHHYTKGFMYKEFTVI